MIKYIQSSNTLMSALRVLLLLILLRFNYMVFTFNGTCFIILSSVFDSIYTYIWVKHSNNSPPVSTVNTPRFSIYQTWVNISCVLLQWMQHAKPPSWIKKPDRVLEVWNSSECYYVEMLWELFIITFLGIIHRISCSQMGWSLWKQINDTLQNTDS